MKNYTIFIICFITAALLNTSFCSDILIIKNDLNSSSQQLYNDAVSFGHNVTTASENEVTYEMLLLYDVVILACGNNPHPVTQANIRHSLYGYSLNGGKILIEGGDVSYASDVLPQNHGFATKVLRVSDWIEHNGGGLNMNSAYSTTQLATFPNMLTSNIEITYNNISDQDVCENDIYSDRFYTWSSYSNRSGVIVYPNVTEPDIIFFTFSYNAVTDASHGRQLLENCLHRLGNVPIGIHTINTEVPESFKVYQNYPNPFNPETKIRFSIPTQSSVKITVFDMTGRQIESLADQNLGIGTYEVIWNASHKASGVYIVMVQTENSHGIIKMSLIK